MIRVFVLFGRPSLLCGEIMAVQVPLLGFACFVSAQPQQPQLSSLQIHLPGVFGYYVSELSHAQELEEIHAAVSEAGGAGGWKDSSSRGWLVGGRRISIGTGARIVWLDVIFFAWTAWEFA